MEDDDYDALAPTPAPPAPLRNTSGTPSVPPSFAFGSNSAPPPAPPAPPASSSAVVLSSSQSPAAQALSILDEPGAVRVSVPASVLDPSLSKRWQEPITPTQPSRTGTPTASPAYNKPATELAPRKPYDFKKSQSYDTDALIRKYGGLTGIPPVPVTVRPAPPPAPSPSPITVRPADVRDQAQKVLDLVDDSLQAPMDIRRTESGGFRAAVTPYTMNRTMSGSDSDYRRSSSGSLGAGGKRVPAALAGIQLQPSSPAWNTSGRHSFSDPSFRHDDLIDEEEDDILTPVPFKDEPIVDVVHLENRAAGSRQPYSDQPYSDKAFDGDFDGGSKSWSSRYSDSRFVSQKHILNQWDQEFQQEQKERKTARNMFASTASKVRHSASAAFSSGSQKVFGSGGFNFRSNHVYGNQKASERPEVNLRTLWKNVDDEAAMINPPRVHKTWQEVMLNKRKRRRVLAIFLCLFLGVVATLSSINAIRARINRMISVGDEVVFYVTSSTPYDDAAEDALALDLANIPSNAEFIFHLGNIQDSSMTLCPNNRYADVAHILGKSPVPVHILPGQEDWVNCPQQDNSLKYWMEAFVDFDLTFQTSYSIKHPEKAPEAFTFLHKGVLFMGLHVVSGYIIDTDAWETREDEMLKFYFGMANQYKGYYRSIVVMGNARPGPQQLKFFKALFSNLNSKSVPVVYIHANQRNEELMVYNAFEDHPQVKTIGVQDGSAVAPVQITVGFGKSPFVVG